MKTSADFGVELGGDWVFLWPAGTVRERARPYQQGLNACCIFLIPPTLCTWAQGRQARAGRVVAARQGEEVERKPWFTGQHSGGLYKRSSLGNWHAQERVWVWQRHSCLQKLPYLDYKEKSEKRGVTKINNARVECNYKKWEQVRKNSLRKKKKSFCFSHKH